MLIHLKQQRKISLETENELADPAHIFGEGNGTPLQCSCLESPRDGGVCWAAIYGVTQGQTRLT